MSLLKQLNLLSGLVRRTLVGSVRPLHQTATLRKVEDRKAMLASLPSKDEGTVGERSIDIDSMIDK